MRTKVPASLIVCAFLGSQPLHGYVQSVHRVMTERAYARILPSLERHVGIRQTDTIGGASPFRLISNGAFDEDRNIRSINHFFDPNNKEPLTITFTPYGIPFPCVSPGQRADRWAIDGFPSDYSITDARQYYADSLLGPNPGTREPAKRELLLALGHIVHLVQDMAQPEHTRNDQHLPQSAIGRDTEASAWENWGASHIAGAGTAAINFDSYATVVLPTYESYFSTNEFQNGRSVGRGMADYSNRNFVTQDTNYDVYTLPILCRPRRPCLNHTEPRINEAEYRLIQDQQYQYIAFEPDETGAIVATQRTIVVDVDAWTSSPDDFYKPSPDRDGFHTFRSSFDMESKSVGCGPIYSLGNDSYKRRAQLLVPRAVGYSAGLINHFFRGDIDVQWAPVGNGAYTMKITNKSAEAIGRDAVVEAVFKATPSYFGRTTQDDTGVIVQRTALLDEIADFDGLTPGESATIVVSPYGLRADDSLLDFDRNVVVTGTLGSEEGAVIGVAQKPVPRTRRTLNFNSSEPAPYFRPANFGGAGVYFVSYGALAAGHPSLPSSSGVYMNQYPGGKFTFVWEQEAFEGRFRLINGNMQARVQVTVSDNPYFDHTLVFDRVMEASEERTVELPPGTQRFSVYSYTWFVAMDDVSWEYVTP
jgi:hypothetical protein